MLIAVRSFRSVLLRMLLFTVLWLGLPGHFALAQALTEAQCKEFGERIETDRDFYVKAFDWDQMLNRVFARADARDTGLDAARTLLRKRVTEGVQGQVRLFESVKMLRVKKGPGDPRVLIRTTLPGPIVSYEELILVKGADGKPRIVDSFVYSAGENLSEQFRRVVIPFVLSTNKMLAQKLFSNRPDVLEHVSTWDLMGKLAVQGKHAEALRTAAKLPESLQRERFVLLLRLKAAKTTNQREYFATLDLWRRTYPIDPTLDALSIDAFAMRKNYPKALECVTDLDKFLGGDPYLDYRRAQLLVQMNDRAAAREAAVRAINREPSLADAGLLAINLLTKEQRYNEVIVVLNKLEMEGGHSRDYLFRAVEGAAWSEPLVNSTQYRAWRGSTDEIDRAGAGGRVGGKVLKLQSIIYVPGRPSATFSGTYVMVGDKIQGHKVVAIEEQSVMLELASGETRVFKLGDTVR